MKHLSITKLAAGAAALGAATAMAHVGVVNTMLPYAVAAKTYELVLAVPHGCAVPNSSPAVEADTYKVEVSIPTGFTGVRPIVDGAFAKPVLVKDGSGAVTQVTWIKQAAYDSAADDQTYRIGLRGTAPNAPFTTLQFNVKQYCKNPVAGGVDLFTDWANYTSSGVTSNQSPKVKIFPARVPGWNKYNLAATNEKHTPADVKTLLTDFFSDAQIVWVTAGTNTGKGVYSANSNTAAKIKALIAKDPSHYDLTTKTDVMLHAIDDIWVKY
ncbi:MAG: DUF1775 domain-containing protein [Rhodoferax sp.]|nr:DUF1775 domain-containing protein [Rhodoferax sp.]